MKKSKDVFKRWKKRSLKFKILTGVGLAVALIVLPLLLFALLIMVFTHASFASVWSNGLLYGLWAIALAAITVFVLFEIRTLGSWRVLKINKDLEDSHFMSEREIVRNEGFTVTEFSNLQNVKDGLLIMAERQRNDMNVVLLNPIHTMVIATTGTGKTTTYIEPSIEILSRTSTKPCMVITDPKGELYGRHANSLKNSGYNVYIIDLTDTYHSTLWNPFNDVFKKTARISEEITQVKNKYMWGGLIYPTYAEAEKSKREFTVRLNDEIYQELQDLIYCMCPVEAAQDKSWQQGARDLLFAMALRMWEDVRDGYMPKEKFNIYNLWWNLTEYARGECEVLKEYIDECADETSRAKGMASTVLVSEDRTLSSYLGSVNQYLHWMADGGVAQLTSGNEIEFSEWDEQPNALFVKIPDMKEGRHGLVSLMLLQLYKALDEKGEKNSELRETPDKRLKRHCYFLMDEFGSLPPIKNFDNIVKIARSLGVFMIPVLQDYAQLNKVYGEQPASTIKNNCNVKIFLGTNDEKTRGEISEACGKHKVKSVSYSENKDTGVNTSAQSVPLIYPHELANLNNPADGVFGNAVVIASGVNPIMSHTTPCFKAFDIFGIEGEARPPEKAFMIFDEQANRYDITKLIFLHHNLEDEDGDAEEVPDTENPIEIQPNDTEKNTKRKTASELAAEQISEELGKLKGKINEDDFIRLSGADISSKIKVLDELAEAATLGGNIFLAMQIEKIISFIKHSINFSAKET